MAAISNPDCGIHGRHFPAIVAREKYRSQFFSERVFHNTFALSNGTSVPATELQYIKIYRNMKALIIIAVCLTLALLLRIIELFTSRKNINSVGGRANRNSRNIAKVDITDAESLKKALELYKDLAD